MAGITRDLKSFRLYSIACPLSFSLIVIYGRMKKIENKSRKNQKGFPFFFLYFLEISLEKGAQQIYVQFSKHKTHK
jgi:hypothetical protein